MANELALITGFQSNAANSIEVVYLATKATLITAFSVTNNTSVNRSYKAYIYGADGAAVPAITPIKFVTSNKGYDLSPPILGQIVPAGGTIRVESSAANSLVFHAAGKTLS